MKKTLSQAQIQELQAGGATVRVSPKAEPEPLPTVTEQPLKEAAPNLSEVVMAQMAANLSQSQRDLLAHIQTMLAANNTKPTAYRLIISRSRNGLIQSIDAVPID